MAEENQNYVIETRNCKNPKCRKPYDAKIFTLLSVPYVLGAGYCPACRRRLAEEDKAREAEAQKRAMEIHKAWVKRTRKAWRETCGIPARFIESSFSTFNPNRKGMETNLKDKFKVCEAYADNFKSLKYPSLLLFSEHSWGVGKTHLVCAIAHRILDKWNGESTLCPVRFVSEPDLYTDIQDTYSGFDKVSEASIIKGLVQVPLLILDDVGKRQARDKSFVQRIMFSIIDGRYRAMLPTVLTANLKPDDLAVYLGGGKQDHSTIDRLVEMCGKFYQIDGESYRWGKG